MKRKAIAIILACAAATGIMAQNFMGPARKAPLCFIDGKEVPATTLRITLDEMKSDSAKRVIANRLGENMIDSTAIATIEVVEDANTAEPQMFNYASNAGAVIITTNEKYTALRWEVNGKERKPAKHLTLIDYFLRGDKIVTEAFPSIKLEDADMIQLSAEKNPHWDHQINTVSISTKTH